jgi:hypothetical protein
MSIGTMVIKLHPEYSKLNASIKAVIAKTRIFIVQTLPYGYFKIPSDTAALRNA